MPLLEDVGSVAGGFSEGIQPGITYALDRKSKETERRRKAEEDLNEIRAKGKANKVLISQIGLPPEISGHLSQADEELLGRIEPTVLMRLTENFQPPNRTPTEELLAESLLQERQARTAKSIAEMEAVAGAEPPPLLSIMGLEPRRVFDPVGVAELDALRSKSKAAQKALKGLETSKVKKTIEEPAGLTPAELALKERLLKSIKR